MDFPVVMGGCESWTIKRSEHQRIDAFELWCWRRLLRLPPPHRSPVHPHPPAPSAPGVRSLPPGPGLTYRISLEQVTEQVTEQAIQIARLTAQVEGLIAQVELLKDERERLRRELDAAHEERREAQRLLTTSEPRKSWIARLFRR